MEEGTINVDMQTWMYPTGTPLNEALGKLYQLENKVGDILDSIRQSVIQGKMDRETRIKRLEELEYNFDIRRKYEKGSYIWFKRCK